MEITMNNSSPMLDLKITHQGDGLPVLMAGTPAPVVPFALNIGTPGPAGANGDPGAPGAPGDTTAADAAAAVAAQAAASLAAALPGLATTQQLDAARAALAALIAAIPECDLDGLVTTVQLNSVGSGLAALIGAIPTTDVQAALAAYGVTTPAHLLALQSALASLIGAIPTADVAAALLAFNSAKASDVETARADLAGRIAAIPTVDLSSVAKTTEQATQHNVTRTAITAARDAVIAALPVPATPAAVAAVKADTATLKTGQTSMSTTLATLATATGLTAARDFIVTAVTAARDLVCGDVAAVKTDTANIIAVQATTAQLTAAVAPLATTSALAALATATGLTAARDYIYNYITTRTQAILDAQATATALAAVSSKIDGIPIFAAGNRSGQMDVFSADKVPSDYTKMAGLDVIPTGGIAAQHTTASGPSFTPGAACHVSAGANQGIYRILGNQLQRFDAQTGKAVGSPVTLPLVGTQTTYAGLAVIGTKIFITGVLSSSNFGSSLHLMYDTATLTTTQLASFPSVIGGFVRSVVTNDARIMTTATVVAGSAQAAATTQFFLYNPSSAAAPVSVSVSMPITRFTLGNNNLLMSVLSNGLVQCIDAAIPASGNCLSCNLTISGNTITPSAAEDTGANVVMSFLLPTATGMLCSQANSPGRAYTIGAGWAVGAVPWAFGSVAAGCQCAYVIPGAGWVFTGANISSNQVTASMYYTSSPNAGSTLIQALKN